jgi:hypothetical protein
LEKSHEMKALLVLEERMSRLTRFTWLLMAFILPGLAACGGGTSTTDASLAMTQVWKTVEVAQTLTAMAVSPTPSITYTPAISLTPQATNTPLITSTALPGSSSATPYTIPTSGGSSSTSCDNANFLDDLTVPDGTVESAGSTFVKTWAFRNIGPCTWTTDYYLVFSYVSDNGKNGVFAHPAPVSFPVKVLPGEELDISVALTAPTQAGTYRVVFVLQNDKGFNIPIRNYNTFEFWVQFVVN